MIKAIKRLFTKEKTSAQLQHEQGNLSKEDLSEVNQVANAYRRATMQVQRSYTQAPIQRKTINYYGQANQNDYQQDDSLGLVSGLLIADMISDIGSDYSSPDCGGYDNSSCDY